MVREYISKETATNIMEWRMFVNRFICVKYKSSELFRYVHRSKNCECIGFSESRYRFVWMFA